jgi:hypothetical protein
MEINMSRKIRKLTPAILKKMVVKEALSGAVEPTEDVKAVEVDADEFGTPKSLEKDVDVAKALKIEERRLRRRLAKVREARKLVGKRILRGL